MLHSKQPEQAGLHLKYREMDSGNNTDCTAFCTLMMPKWGRRAWWCRTLKKKMARKGNRCEGLQNYYYLDCLFKKNNLGTSHCWVWLISLPFNCFDILGLGYSCSFLCSMITTLFCIKVLWPFVCSARTFLQVRSPLLWWDALLTVLINEKYYCTFNLSSF